MWTISWGDGSQLTSASGNLTSAAHTYATAGTYTITATTPELMTGPYTSPTRTVTVSGLQPPANLSAPSVSSSGVLLSWSPAATGAAPASYDVFRNGSKITASPITAAAYQDSGLSPSTSLQLHRGRVLRRGQRLVAQQRLGGDDTSAASTSYDTTPPTAPSGLSSSSSSATDSSLTSELGGGDGQRRCHRLLDSPQRRAGRRDDLHELCRQRAGSLPRYSYSVIAYDAAGNASTAARFRPASGADQTPPSVPGEFVVSANAGSSISLTWNASSDNVGVAGYDVYRNGTLLGSTSSTAYTDSTVTSGQIYNYSLDARDAAGNNPRLTRFADGAGWPSRRGRPGPRTSTSPPTGRTIFTTI